MAGVMGWVILLGNTVIGDLLRLADIILQLLHQSLGAIEALNVTKAL